MDQKQFSQLRWGSLVTAISLSLLGWASAQRWNFADMNIYRLFTLFGLIAFSIMITHFLLLALQTHSKNITHDKKYSLVSGYIVLFCLLLHPALIIVQLWVDGNGLPPKSYAALVGQQMVYLVYFGVIALLTFLFYEATQHWAKKEFIIKNWFAIILTQIIAMFLVFIHATQLGFTTGYGWYQIVWYGQGIILLISAAVIIANQLTKNSGQKQHQKSQ